MHGLTISSQKYPLLLLSLVLVLDLKGGQLALNTSAFKVAYFIALYAFSAHLALEFERFNLLLVEEGDQSFG